MKYEAPDYSPEGVRTFQEFLSDHEKIDVLEMYGAFDGDKLVGVAATRNKGTHIALLFVDGAYHRRGIGRLLFQEVLRNSTGDAITVNSSPFALEFYRKIGFIVMEGEKVVEGIRYTPMKYENSNKPNYATT